MECEIPAFLHSTTVCEETGRRASARVSQSLFSWTGSQDLQDEQDWVLVALIRPARLCVGNGVCPRILPVNPANPAILSKRTEGPGRGGGFSTARATALPRFTHFSHTFPPEPVVDSPLERPLLSIPTVRPAFFPIYRFTRFNPFNRFTLHS